MWALGVMLSRNVFVANDSPMSKIFHICWVRAIAHSSRCAFTRTPNSLVRIQVLRHNRPLKGPNIPRVESWPVENTREYGG